MLNIKTRVALKKQNETKAWMAKKIAKGGLGAISTKETSFGGPRIKFRGSVPIEHAIRMARLNRLGHEEEE